MNMGGLKTIINGLCLSDDTPVYVASQGYCNYNFRESRPYNDTDIFLIVHDGKLFITDECAVEDENGIPI